MDRQFIRCAVLGLGRLGYWHAENLANRVKGAKLACVVDKNPEQAGKVAGELGIDRWTTDADSVLESDDIDAVVVATPTPTHAELIMKAAECGKPVFVEKPITGNLAEADGVIRTLDKYNAICQVGFMRRFDPGYAEAKRRILAGDIGEPLYFKSVSRDPFSPPAEFIRHSGGLFVDMSVHDFDIARFLTGSDVVSVAAHGSVLKHDFMREIGDIDQGICYMTFASGAAGDIEVSRNAYYGYDIRSEVIGTEGTLLIGSLKYHDVHILTPNGRTHDIFPHFAQRFADAYLLEMQHFIDCLLRRETPSVGARDGRAALAAAIAAQRSFETGTTVLV